MFGEYGALCEIYIVYCGSRRCEPGGRVCIAVGVVLASCGECVAREWPARDGEAFGVA